MYLLVQRRFYLNMQTAEHGSICEYRFTIGNLGVFMKDENYVSILNNFSINEMELWNRQLGTIFIQGCLTIKE